MPARTLYASQLCTIVNYANTTGTFPVQSANCETSIPIEDISIIGKLGSAGRFQKEVATCKSDVKIYLGNDTSNNNAVLGSFLSSLTGEALSGAVSTIKVTPNGYTMSGIVSKIGVDMSKGNFAMLDLSFAGVGEPDYDAQLSSIGGAGTEPGAAIAVSPITTGVRLYGMADFQLYGGYFSSGTSGVPNPYNNKCPNSVKFNMDIPNEVVSCLGGAISGSQVTVASGNVQVGKPPFKGTLVVEGTSAESCGKVVFGEVNDVITVVFNDGKVTSKSFNQAAGNVGATYNFTVEGTDIVLS